MTDCDCWNLFPCLWNCFVCTTGTPQTGRCESKTTECLSSGSAATNTFWWEAGQRRMTRLDGADTEAAGTRRSTPSEQDKHIRIHNRLNLEADSLCCQVPLLSARTETKKIWGCGSTKLDRWSLEQRGAWFNLFGYLQSWWRVLGRESVGPVFGVRGRGWWSQWAECSGKFYLSIGWKRPASCRWVVGTSLTSGSNIFFADKWKFLLHWRTNLQRPVMQSSWRFTETKCNSCNKRAKTRPFCFYRQPN